MRFLCLVFSTFIGAVCGEQVVVTQKDNVAEIVTAATTTAAVATTKTTAATIEHAVKSQDDPWNCSMVASKGGFVPLTLSSPSKTMALTFIPYGGTVQKIVVNDRRGNSVDVVLGFDDAAQYCLGTYGQAGHPYFGAVIGRIANRIRDGSFVLNGKTYSTPINEPAGNDTLHGGTAGFDRQIWQVQQLNASSALLSYTSPDGEMGFPGSVSLNVTYTLRDSAWVIDYDAVAIDQDTVVGLTQHTYWNLNGCAQNVLDHVLYIPDAAQLVSVNEYLIPNGKLEAVSEVMDFRQPKSLAQDINKTTKYPWGTGYDNAYVFNNWTQGQAPASRVHVFSTLSGIQMVVSTDQPAVQVYSGNQLSGSIPAKSDQTKGAFYQHWGALALEASNYPDAVNHENFPTAVLRKGERYKQRTMYAFGVVPEAVENVEL